MARAREKGFTFLIAIVLIGSIAALALTQALRARADTRGRSGELHRRFARTQAAIIGYVAQMGRMPCPARPDLSISAETGDEVRTGGPQGNCTYSQGTVPWHSLGMRQDNAYDPWGWKISYRVYNGSGTLTQDSGANMGDCDCDTTSANQGVNNTGSASKLCKSNHKTSYSDFLQNKGFTVTDFGATQTSIAYVLVSHGPTGYGAYNSGGTQNTLPTSTNELANISASGPFVRTNESGPTVAASDSAHFDDLIAYMRVDNLIAAAGLYARYWPNPPTLTNPINGSRC